MRREKRQTSINKSNPTTEKTTRPNQTKSAANILRTTANRHTTPNTKNKDWMFFSFCFSVFVLFCFVDHTVFTEQCGKKMREAVKAMMTATLVLLMTWLMVTVGEGEAYRCDFQLINNFLNLTHGPAVMTNDSNSYSTKRTGPFANSVLSVTSSQSKWDLMLLYFGAFGSEAYAAKVDFTRTTINQAILDGQGFSLSLFDAQDVNVFQNAAISSNTSSYPALWKPVSATTRFSLGVDFVLSNGAIKFLVNCGNV